MKLPHNVCFLGLGFFLAMEKMAFGFKGTNSNMDTWSPKEINKIVVSTSMLIEKGASSKVCARQFWYSLCLLNFAFENNFQF